MKRTLVNRDRLMNAPRTAVANAMVSTFNALQHLPSSIQVLALAGAFALMTEVSKVSAPDSITAVTNLMVDPETTSRRELRFQAMKYHLEQNLKDGL